MYNAQWKASKAKYCKTQRAWGPAFWACNKTSLLHVCLLGQFGLSWNLTSWRLLALPTLHQESKDFSRVSLHACPCLSVGLVPSTSAYGIGSPQSLPFLRLLLHCIHCFWCLVCFPIFAFFLIHLLLSWWPCMWRLAWMFAGKCSLCHTFRRAWVLGDWLCEGNAQGRIQPPLLVFSFVIPIPMLACFFGFVLSTPTVS